MALSFRSVGGKGKPRHSHTTPIDAHKNWRRFPTFDGLEIPQALICGRSLVFPARKCNKYESTRLCNRSISLSLSLSELPLGTLNSNGPGIHGDTSDSCSFKHAPDSGEKVLAKVCGLTTDRLKFCCSLMAAWHGLRRFDALA